MNWDDLRIFVAVARASQIARAAAALRIDPTTVSRRLRRLEAATNTILFEQQSDGQRLTESGNRLLAVAEVMERQVVDFSARPQSASAVSGLVRASVSEGFGTWFVASRLGAFAARYPAVSVDLVASSGFLSPSKRETDVAVLLARPRKGPLVTRKLIDYGLRLYASRTYHDQSVAVAAPEQLANHSLVGYIPDFIYAPELHYLSEIAPRLEPKLRSSSINGQYQLIRSGAGIGVLPCFIGAADPSLVTVLPDVHIVRSFYLVTHRDTRHLPQVRHFVDWLVTTARDHQTFLLG